MDARRSTQAEDTVAILQRAAGLGLPVLIPGALEKRVAPTAAGPTGAAGPATPYARTDTVDRRRLEHEREGGGAPNERAGARHLTILARLWRRLFHPIASPAN